MRIISLSLNYFKSMKCMPLLLKTFWFPFRVDYFEFELAHGLKVHSFRFENLPICSSSYENNMLKIPH